MTLQKDGRGLEIVDTSRRSYYLDLFISISDAI